MISATTGSHKQDLHRIDDRDGQALARYARAAIDHALGGPRPQISVGEELREPGATFVTLHRDGDFQGCIGTIEATRPIVDDVAEHAVAAALLDPRGAPLERSDLDHLDVEVSLLSPLEPIEYDGTEAGAAQAIVPFRDGVVLGFRGRRATFLPQVWDDLPQPSEFLFRLKRKAGLPSDFWSDEITLQRYTTRVWHDPAAAVLP